MNKTLRLNILKARTAMNVKVSVFVTCAEAIVYLLLYNLHDCTFKDFFSKYDQIRRKLQIWSDLLKKSLMEK